MQKFHTIILSIVLVALASRAIGMTLQTQSQSQTHLGTQGFLCPDRGWVTTPAGQPTPTYTVRWCYSGSGCFVEDDYVYVSVTTRDAYIQCRAETSKILEFAFGIVSGIASVAAAAAGGITQMALQAAKVGLKQGIKIGKEQIQGNGGSDGCYCFAERWTSVESIYATVISDDKRSVSLEVSPDFLSQVNSENVNQFALLKIEDGSCTSTWIPNVCQYNYVRTRKTMSWSDLADELAWLGDRNNWPGNLWLWRQGDPPSAQCSDSPRREGIISKKWCFNNARSNCDDDIITFGYRGSAEIRCRAANSLEIAPVGTMIKEAYGVRVSKQSGSCICYPANFDSRPAKVMVHDESGDALYMDILPDQFWGLDLDTVQNGVKAKFTSVTTGNWFKNVRSLYEGAQVKYKYDWDEFGDDFAWWGDRNSKTDGLYKLRTYACAQPTFATFDISRDLTAGNCLYSNGNAIRQTDRTQLNMQADGHLCIYQRNSVNDNWVYKWGSLTAGQGVGPYRACMQIDGNFVVYDSRDTPLWHTHTNFSPECSILKVQPDGNVVVYQSKSENTTPAWASWTLL